MTLPAISVVNLGKKYLISHGQREQYPALRDVIAGSFRRLRKGLFSTPCEEEFWALRDVSFNVEPGARVGIIGRNGAGKSTLLKVLSRITEPTTGSIRIRGRVASLLEVGTGFHPELSGRENIFLNGAILGMQRAEIKRKFDEIVDFAEIERFLDTPVKRYSSGMYVRLAFAVAAHLEPEILVVDEVLAVGDALFQKKCLGKMEDVSLNQGRTVLFVSHNMEAISSLCNQGIVLGAGTVQYRGEVEEAIGRYMASWRDLEVSVANCQSRAGSGGIRIHDVRLECADGQRVVRVTPESQISLCLSALVEPSYRDGKKISVGFGIDSVAGRRLFTAVSSWEKAEIVTRGEQLEVSCLLPSLPLVPGRYLISAAIMFQTDTLDSVIHCAAFDMTEGAKGSYAQRGREHGELCFPSAFTCK